VAALHVDGPYKTLRFVAYDYAIQHRNTIIMNNATKCQTARTSAWRLSRLVIYVSLKYKTALEQGALTPLMHR